MDALRADMRELLDQVRTLIQDADRRVSDLERARAETGPAPSRQRARIDDDW
ncbi:MAG: hypothetical protein WAO15_08680 [Mycobacterium sp.]